MKRDKLLLMVSVALCYINPIEFWQWSLWLWDQITVFPASLLPDPLNGNSLHLPQSITSVYPLWPVRRMEIRPLCTTQLRQRDKQPEPPSPIFRSNRVIARDFPGQLPNKPSQESKPGFTLWPLDSLFNCSYLLNSHHRKGCEIRPVSLNNCFA